MVIFSALCLLSSLGAYLAEINGLIEPVPTSLAVIDIAFVMSGLAMSAFLLSFIVFSAVGGLGRARIGEQALRESNLELQASRDALDAQARQLERRARYLEVTAAVAQDAASMLAVEDLLSRATTLIGDQFGYYHVGLFFSDQIAKMKTLKSEVEALNEAIQQVNLEEARLVTKINEINTQPTWNQYQVLAIEKEVRPYSDELRAVQQKKIELIERKGSLESEIRELTQR